MIDLNKLSHEEKEALAEDCEDYLLHRNIPLYSHSYDNIIAHALKEGYQMDKFDRCLLYTSPSPRDQRGSRMPSSA